MFSQLLADLVERNLEGRAACFRGKRRRNSGGLAHPHARSLDTETRIREAITADAPARDDEIAAPFRNECSQGDRRGHTGFERFGFRVERIGGDTPEEIERTEQQLARFWNLAIIIDAADMALLH